MSKALVIKNANFSVNKVATVIFNDVPCTGISFASSDISLTSLGVATIPYTVTPNNTTDEVIFVSSDDTVLSATNGIFTANGIGECDLTVTCGAYSDSCHVSVEVLANNLYILRSSSSSYGSSGGAHVTAGTTFNTTSRMSAVQKQSVIGIEHRLLTVAEEQSPFVPGVITQIPIPQNTTVLHVHVEALYDNGLSVIFMDGKTYYTDVVVGSIIVSGYKYISEVNIPASFNTGRTGDAYIPIPKNADGYIINIRPYNSTPIEGTPSESDLFNYAYNTMKLSVEYLTEAPTSN